MSKANQNLENEKPLSGLLQQFKKGDQVATPQIPNGEVFKVMQVQDELQCLTIYGNNAAGRTIKRTVYNDDRTLTLAQA